MHGSRDVRPQIAIAHLAQLVQQRLNAIVGTAALECTPLPLHEQIQHFGHQVLHQGIDHIQIVPLFLLPGVHVMEDIPEQVAIAQQNLPSITLQLVAYLGRTPRLSQLVEKRFAGSSAAARILLSHGSRRPNANLPIEQLAMLLNAVPAYWSVAPSLETQVKLCLKQGASQIAILPYFLFSGGITDAIALSLESLRQQFPQVQLDLLAPLDVSQDLADLVVPFILETACPSHDVRSVLG